ncbi:DNA polymerase III subunit delta' [Oscillatoria sp. CS-180]|uniref:DNA polymerase III subunit delta' n=1 Tax=Oscillatoria sp. CS-180 TaxID=3021720 RepID=UPI00232FB18F|nr:DNA polymerase III subunit delta' [Oscillatoria sp. CS-180]MDB9528100.1 DNA polymerase III subunit delta' [Oscillatoria sp. CS-180]
MVRETFSDLLGQETAVDLLCQAIAKQRIAPAYLFAGPAGTGRRLAAIRFAECLLHPSWMETDGKRLHGHNADPQVLRRRIQDRNHPDLMWVEPTYLHKGKPITAAEAVTLDLKRRSPPQIRLEQIRDITRFLARPTLESSRAVVVVEGAETMAEAPANGLLKTLEEPGKATLILLATDSANLLPTIVSRCQTIPFRRLPSKTLATILTQAGHSAILHQQSVLEMAQGSPGQAIAAWEQLQTLPAELLSSLKTPPSSLIQALNLARRISKEIDTESQLWLVEYLQHHAWQTQRSPVILAALEKARLHLRRFVQPRLVWEVTLMSFLEE